ncbi:glycine betaine ABC transporter substrate-binding protein [Corynebacterium choanae]|uniref:Substrate binding domain of ABC-type glycine betaine transport system n=1 Tax=Corynebacterium choanae TaxID=1862358 RepID=A0A3G6J6R8_9CORY|nr:glycine betaine ABC transporter substrate-binding protein [Corynebacterium choanae]AZA12618.1 Substrate binding domain of ABC-type glycine betaine transport system [Corynebacterium choanae]
MPHQRTRRRYGRLVVAGCFTATLVACTSDPTTGVDATSSSTAVAASDVPATGDPYTPRQPAREQATKTPQRTNLDQLDPRVTTNPDDADIVLGYCGGSELAFVNHLWAIVFANNGYTVADRGLIGPVRADCVNALQAGEISIMPDYSEALAQFFYTRELGREVPLGATNQQSMSALKTALPAGLALGKPVVADTATTVYANRGRVTPLAVTSLADLYRFGAIRVVVGAHTIADSRNISELFSAYQAGDVPLLGVADSPVSDAAALQAVADGDADLAFVSATTPIPAALQPQLVQLGDPDHRLPASKILALMSGKAVDGDARVGIRAINKFLTTEALATVQSRHADGESIIRLAREFAAAHPVSTTN